MRSIRLFVILLSILCFSDSVCLAQYSRSRRKAKEEVSIDSLMRSYRFNQAIELIEDKIEVAEKKRRRPVNEIEKLNQQLEKARSLSAMMSGTERVQFIDSVVVDKENFLSAFRLGEDCGTIGATNALLPEGIGDNQLIGNVAHRNELNDKIYFSIHDTTGVSGLYVTERIGNKWNSPKPLKGLAGKGVDQDYPFVLSDGVTMYYADKNKDGLGGYDIYVTRYSAANESYLKPENIGMPFNSAANDYMYVIDETNRIGWFATDRNQPDNKVCIYIFQPSDTRRVYNSIVVGEDWLRQAAMLHSIKECMLNKTSLERAKERLEKITAEPTIQNFGKKVRYIINDDIVYTSLLQFKSEQAQVYAMEWTKELVALHTAEKKLEIMRQKYNHAEAGSDVKKHLYEQETYVDGLRDKVAILAKKMRSAELKK